MKSTVILIVLCIVGYWLYTYYEENPAELPGLTHRQRNLVSTPIPVDQPTPTPQPITGPKLDAVKLKDGATLTHVRVTTARENTLVIICDQGLFEVNYDRLDPQFRAYYQPSPTPTLTQVPTGAPTPTPATAAAPKQPVQRTFEEENQARLSFNQTKINLEAKQQADLDVMTRWYKQSSFDPNAMSQSQFDTAKADYDATTAQLGSLVAAGP
jgi:hypothetical protein